MPKIYEKGTVPKTKNKEHKLKDAFIIKMQSEQRKKEGLYTKPPTLFRYFPKGPISHLR